MTITTFYNNTRSVVDLKEGNAGVLRHVTDIQPGKDYPVHSSLNETYKEYLCASNGSDQFTLSSDDLSEWKEIEIRVKKNDPTKLEWEGKPASTTPPSHSWFMSKLRNTKLGGLIFKPKTPGTVIITTDTPAATT